MFDAVVLGTVVTEESVTTDGYVAISGEKIGEVGHGTPPAARTIFDRSGSLIFPGLVDGHVHTGSALGWQGIEGTTKTAAAGGVTTCVDMPLNASPPTVDARSFDLKLAAGSRASMIDFALWGGLIPGNREDMDDLAARGVIGFKAFMADSGLPLCKTSGK